MTKQKYAEEIIYLIRSSVTWGNYYTIPALIEKSPKMLMWGLYLISGCVVVQ